MPCEPPLMKTVVSGHCRRDLPGSEESVVICRAPGAASTFFSRHRARIIGVTIDLNAMLGLGLAGKLLGLDYWVTTAAVAVSYSAVATSFLGRSFGVAAAEWLLRTLKSLPSVRRLQSSRAQNA